MITGKLEIIMVEIIAINGNYAMSGLSKTGNKTK